MNAHADYPVGRNLLAMTLAQFLRHLATLPPHTRAAIWRHFRRGGSMRAAVTAWLACVESGRVT